MTANKSKNKGSTEEGPTMIRNTGGVCILHWCGIYRDGLEPVHKYKVYRAKAFFRIDLNPFRTAVPFWGQIT